MDMKKCAWIPLNIHTMVCLHQQLSFRPSTGVTVKNVIFEHLGNMVTVVISFVLS